MPEEPPPMIQELSDAASLKTQGRLSRNSEARRFFAWWSVVNQARAVRYNFQRHQLERAVEPRALADAWAEIASSGLARWPHLPWRVPGFAEYFLNLQQLEGAALPSLWKRFEIQLNHADALSQRHVVPSGGFEALVERRISEKTGAPNFDPQTRRANAVLALAELSDAAADNGLHFEDARVARLGELIARLYERASREYPSLYWEGEGILESYSLLGLVNGWDLQRVLHEFAAEWSLANALAAGGAARTTEQDCRKRPRPRWRPGERAIRAFIDTQALRAEEKNRPSDCRARARPV